MQTLIEYPSRRSPEGWSPGDVMENIKNGPRSSRPARLQGKLPTSRAGCEAVDAIGVIESVYCAGAM
jgi:hypothetical protein